MTCVASGSRVSARVDVGGGDEMARKRKSARPRSHEALVAILHCKGQPLRDRRERRPKDARRSFKREEW